MHCAACFARCGTASRSRPARRPAYRLTAGSTVARHSPNPMGAAPSRCALARRWTSSPSWRKVRVSPVGRPGTSRELPGHVPTSPGGSRTGTARLANARRLAASANRPARSSPSLTGNDRGATPGADPALTAPLVARRLQLGHSDAPAHVLGRGAPRDESPGKLLHAQAGSLFQLRVPELQLHDRHPTDVEPAQSHAHRA